MQFIQYARKKQGTYGLAQWSALSHGDLVTLLNTESWGNVGGEVLVSLLVSGVFWNEVEVFAADNESAVHLGGHNGSGQDTATDGDETSEWALLVCTARQLALLLRDFLSIRSLAYAQHQTATCSTFHSSFLCYILPNRTDKIEGLRTDVCALNRCLWRAEAQSNVLVPSAPTLSNSAGLGLRLVVKEDVRLLLESALRLDGQLGGHVCVCGEVAGRWVVVRSLMDWRR